jgi:sterol desaturase/sphingolipid hydroxylase (fatty acid hydroxylase superfamily)
MLKIMLHMIAIDSVRYVLVAGAAYLVVRAWRDRLPHRVVRELAKAPQMRREVAYSALTIVLFSLVGTGLWFGARAGVFRLYDDVAEYGWVYFAVSIALLVVLQDAYFYWTHRAMHHKRVFRHVHLLHHLSRDPSPWAAYAFAPAEALVHAAFVPLVALVVPVHHVALFVFLTIMISRNVLAHLGIELAPASLTRRFGWSTTTTHHALHHHRPHGNYGFYFTWWDRAMGTTDATYEATFESLTRAATPARARRSARSAAVARGRRRAAPDRRSSRRS